MGLGVGDLGSRGTGLGLWGFGVVEGLGVVEGFGGVGVWGLSVEASVD